MKMKQPKKAMLTTLVLALLLASFSAGAAGLQGGSHAWYYSVTTILVCLACASVLWVVWLAQKVGLGALLVLAATVLVCLIGAGAAMVGWIRLENWCAWLLTDDDGQEENPC